MATERVENREGSCTEVCGDPKIWFPMRVTYGRGDEGEDGTGQE